jgi:SAM-dependent methyltransferase
MVGVDRDWVAGLLKENVFAGPVLELGTGYGGETCRAVVEAAGLKYVGTDLEEGPGVDIAANFERDGDIARLAAAGPFGAVLILNVLEHTFEPIRILDNARTLLKSGGVLVLVTPAVWPLHSYPIDTWRILPDFYQEYAKRRGMRLLRERFDFVGFGPVHAFRNADGAPAFPPPARQSWKLLFGRAVHKAFNTFGRAMFQPSHVAIGAVLIDSGSSEN